MREFTLTTTFAYNHGSYLFTGGEVYDWYGPSVTLSRAITWKLTASLAYQLYVRTSDQSGRGYTANTITLQASYQF